MKKSLIIIPLAVLICGMAACSNEVTGEEPFIETSGGKGEGKASNPYWDWADKYPGQVSSNLPRVGDFEVLVKGGYEPVAYAPDSAVLQSTGLYAPSDQSIEIVVPNGVTDLHYQIGMGYKLSDGQLRKRYENVVTRGRLNPGSNTVSSYFGGFLYLCYPAGKIAPADITVKVSGAVESDDYVAGQTDTRQWLTRMLERAQILATGTEDKDSLAFLNWCELRSEKVIYTMGVAEMGAMTNPQTLLDQLGLIVDAYLKFAGYDPANQPPMRVYTDIQLPDPAQTPAVQTANVFRYGGYPIGCVRGETVTTFVDEKRVIDPDLLRAQTSPTFTNWFSLLYGFSEAVQSPWQRSALLWAPSLNMGYYYFARTLGLWPGKNINFVNNVANLNNEYDTLSSTRDNGDVYLGLGDDPRTTLLMQLTQYLGWELFPYVSQRARELGFTYVEDTWLKGLEASDFFCMAACEYANQNLLPFFKKWNFPVSTEAMAYMKKFPDAATPFWETYDAAAIPVFTPRTPNKNIARPPGRMNYTMYDDMKTYWYIAGEVLDIDDYLAGTRTVLRTGNSIDTPGWQMAFDNIGDRQHMSGLFGHVKKDYADGSYAGNVMEYTLHLDYDAEDPAHVPAAVPINVWAYWQTDAYYFTPYVYEIKYWDENLQEWKPTVPDKFKMVINNNYEFYHFDQPFTTSKIQFKLQPIVHGATSNFVTTQTYEIGLGYTRYQ